MSYSVLVHVFEISEPDPSDGYVVQFGVLEGLPVRRVPAIRAAEDDAIGVEPRAILQDALGGGRDVALFGPAPVVDEFFDERPTATGRPPVVDLEHRKAALDEELGVEIEALAVAPPWAAVGVDDERRGACARIVQQTADLETLVGVVGNRSRRRFRHAVRLDGKVLGVGEVGGRKRAVVGFDQRLGVVTLCVTSPGVVAPGIVAFEVVREQFRPARVGVVWRTTARPSSSTLSPAIPKPATPSGRSSSRASPESRS
jgi:hypothetical protein